MAATSPQMTWRHEYVETGVVRFPNLDLAIHAAKLARKYPNEPAPKLIDRLVAASEKRGRAPAPGPGHHRGGPEPDRGRDRGRAEGCREGGGEGILRHAMCAKKGGL